MNPTDSEGRSLALDQITLRRMRAGVVAVVLLGLAVAALALGQPWVGADPDTEASLWAAGQRDAATQVATEGLLSLNTIDHRRIGATVGHWADITTGALSHDVRNGRAEVVRRAQHDRTVASARLVQAAVTAFDAEAGTATVIAVLEISASKAGAKPTTTRNRFRALVQREDDQWKLAYFETLAAQQ
jgi:Mce-associated membrane protein